MVVICLGVRSEERSGDFTQVRAVFWVEAVEAKSIRIAKATTVPGGDCLGIHRGTMFLSVPDTRCSIMGALSTCNAFVWSVKSRCSCNGWDGEGYRLSLMGSVFVEESNEEKIHEKTLDGDREETYFFSTGFCSKRD